jgi:S1-C subfamily serine protease
MNATDLSNAVSELVEAAGRSVVRVRVEGGRGVSGTVFSEKGHVIAINHTVERDEAELGLPDGGTAKARVVGRDTGTDLALLQTYGLGPVSLPAPWTDLDDARVGHLVVGIYRPGATTRAMLGIVAALGDAWRTRYGSKIDRYLEASLPLQPGFSGGLLVNASGKALGLSTSGLVRGVPLGIPAVTVKRVGEALMTGGRVRRGYLGVGSYPVALPESLQPSLAQESGLLVTSVQSDSPASRAGVLLGDVVVSVEGQPTAEPADLLPALDEDRVGREVVLRVLRAGELREVRVTVGERGRAA